MVRKLSALSLTAALVLTGCNNFTPAPISVIAPPVVATVTPQSAIQHIVVIYGENVSFDHYFGTYPNAANTGGTTFTAATGTPTNINNYVSNPNLLTANPNLTSGNGTSAANPFRLSPGQAGTADQDHAYGPEQLAFDNGKMDLFPNSVGTPDTATLVAETAAPGIVGTTALTMGYYDGNTVTAMWNYAQHYAMNDHSFGSTFGPSTPGALNMISGQTNGVTYPFSVPYSSIAASVIPDGQGGYTDIGDADPTGDVCSSPSKNFSMTGKNIGDLLNAAGITWGFFQGGFNLTLTNKNGTSSCLAGEASGSRSTASVNIPGNPTTADYSPHHQPFQYYASTSNLNHNRPTPGIAIGATDATGANHEYDALDFNAALTASTPTMAAVSFIKAPAFQDGHAGYSDPLDEQTFVVNEINMIQSSPFWANTAIIIAYDDSDGWYDHLTDIVNGSQTTSDAAICNATAPSLPGPLSNGVAVQGRCGHGPRLPFIVISPWAKKNFVDNTPIEQASITRFIEDIFLSSTRIGTGSLDSSAGSIMNMFTFTTTGGVPPNPNVVLLNPTTGAVTTGN
jgi:phospholipase C